MGWPSPVTSLEKALPAGARIFGKNAGGQRGLGGMKTLSSRARKEEEGWAEAARQDSLEGLWGVGSKKHEMAVQMIVLPILRYLGGCFWDTRAPVGSGGSGVGESGSGVEVDRVRRSHATAMVRSTRSTALRRFPHRSGVWTNEEDGVSPREVGAKEHCHESLRVGGRAPRNFLGDFFGDFHNFFDELHRPRTVVEVPDGGK
jgi:hypothetical protein